MTFAGFNAAGGTAEEAPDYLCGSSGRAVGHAAFPGTLNGMSTSAELSASVVKKLKTFLKQGGEHLEAIDALVRRLGADSLNTADLDLDGPKALRFFADEVDHQSIGKARKWVKSLDTYAAGYLPPSLRQRVTRHPDGSTEAESVPAVIDNARIAIHSRMETVKHLVGTAAPTPPGPDRDSAGGWQHIRELGLLENAVLDGYLATIRVRRTVAERRSAIAAGKELLEATMKGAIRYADPSASGFEKDDLPKLWTQLRGLIQEDSAISPALGGKDLGVSKVLKTMSNIVAGVTETRNKVGYGHGNSEAPKGLQESHVVLIIDSTHTLTRFITARLNEKYS
ncbi:abortive infection family protein [Streptomyces goshikiensis]|uniref:abortive infection family protein n=1 Tax=Streptomyces goshikiensis TaxID=1942 RepID=UPI00380E7C18